MVAAGICWKPRHLLSGVGNFHPGGILGEVQFPNDGAVVECGGKLICVIVSEEVVCRVDWHYHGAFWFCKLHVHNYLINQERLKQLDTTPWDLINVQPKVIGWVCLIFVIEVHCFKFWYWSVAFFLAEREKCRTWGVQPRLHCLWKIDTRQRLIAQTNFLQPNHQVIFPNSSCLVIYVQVSEKYQHCVLSPLTSISVGYFYVHVIFDGCLRVRHEKVYLSSLSFVEDGQY